MRILLVGTDYRATHEPNFLLFLFGLGWCAEMFKSCRDSSIGPMAAARHAHRVQQLFQGLGRYSASWYRKEKDMKQSGRMDMARSGRRNVKQSGRSDMEQFSVRN